MDPEDIRSRNQSRFYRNYETILCFIDGKCDFTEKDETLAFCDLIANNRGLKHSKEVITIEPQLEGLYSKTLNGHWEERLEIINKNSSVCRDLAKLIIHKYLLR